MYDLSVTHIDRYMSDSASAAVEEKVSCLDASQVYRCTAAGLCRCRTRNADAEVCKYRLCKSGTVSSVCQACAAPYVWISDKLYCKVYDFLSQRR